MEIQRLFRLFWHWSWFIILCMLIAGAGAFFVSRSSTPMYRARAVLLINEGINSSVGAQYNALRTSELLARSYAKRLTNSQVLAETAKNLGIDSDPNKSIGSVSVQPEVDTNLLNLSVTNADPQLARDVANEIPKVFAARNAQQQGERFAIARSKLQAELEQVSEEILAVQVKLKNLGNESLAETSTEKLTIENELARLQATYDQLLKSSEELRITEANNLDSLLVDEPAKTPSAPFRPRVMLTTVIAVIVGGMIGVFFVLLFGYLDKSLKTAEDVENALDLFVIGKISHLPTADQEKEGLMVIDQPRSRFSEDFRELRTNLEFAGVDAPIRSILVTSADPSAGKSTIAANLAAIISQQGKRTILLDCDLHKPKVHTLLGIHNSLGLTDVFRHQAQTPDVVRQWHNDMSVVTSGNLPPNPTELLGSTRMSQIISELGELSDVVVIDSPPAIVSDATILSAKVDAVILVVRAGVTDVTRAKKQVEQLNRAGARIVGVVFNGEERKRSEVYYGGYLPEDSGEEGSRKRSLSQRLSGIF